jgi:isoleucyl-tRNA synthetase
MPFASGAREILGYPADYIAEAVDQTRGWFYTLLAISTLLDQGACYKNVISLGHILDEKGQKMSKSLGNIIEPDEILDRYGADNLRFYLFSINQPGMAKRFREKDLLTSGRKNLMLLWNMVLFFKSYSEIDGWKFSGRTEPRVFLDKWLAERTDRLVDGVTKSLNDYQVTNASRQIEDYIQELSTWYLRLSRKRRDKDFYDNFHRALLILVKVMAPFMPFSVEYLYQNLICQLANGQEPISVHLADFPVSVGLGRENLERADKIRQIISQVTSIRQQKGIRLRQPLNKLRVGLKMSEEELEILRQETNVLEVESGEGKGREVELDTQVTPQLEQLGIVRDLKRQIQNLRRKANCRWDETVTLALGVPQGKGWIKRYYSEIEKETLTRIVSALSVGKPRIQTPDAQARFQDFDLKLKRG